MFHPTRRHASAAVLGLFMASLLLAILPGAAMACSCVMPAPLADSANDPNTVVFSGTIMPTGRPAVDVAVQTWFKGDGEAVTSLAADGFSDQGGGADCRIPYPNAGSNWIFVAYLMPETGTQPHVNLCSRQAALDTPDGQALLAEAVAAFGEGVSQPSASPATSGPLESVGQAIGGAGPIIAAVAVVGIVFVGAAIFLRRRPDET